MSNTLNVPGKRWGPRQNFGASRMNGFDERRPRKENIRFGVNKRGKATRNNLVIDEHIQEATPEHLRIEIDNIIKAFLADPEQTEHIFPSDLNNLQRKYIHYKAQIMNIVSKSYGKDPNRHLHLKKKPREVSGQAFQVYPCEEILKELEEFDKKHGEVDEQPQTYRAIKRYEKVYGRLQDSEPVVPKLTQVDGDIQAARKNLPIFEKKNTVMEAISHHQVIIISSETGSGKTTQIPQYILEHSSSQNIPCKIICTQPRRISTVAAAERVAYERGEGVGESVGYHIRLESKSGYNTNLVYCTVGVFLRNLMCGNKCLNNITHVIVDEIHERDKLSDFMLICLRQNLPLFPHLRVILMSATVDSTKFQEYFQFSTVLSIPGRLFPIQAFFLEEILSMTQFFTPQMRSAMSKLQQKQTVQVNSEVSETASKTELSEQDQETLNYALEAYMNFSDDYDYTVHYEEATADLLQLFISEDVPVDQQHSEKGWTALMIACHLGDVEFVSKLCTMGASMEVADELGKTAYDYAKVTNKNKTIQLLDYIKEQKSTEKAKTPNTNDSQYLRQLYDMTTPDDFIDYDLIVALVKYIHVNSEKGSILIFLPGYDEIMQCNDHITDSDLDINSYRIFFLHSSMNMKDQCDVFKPLHNQRKIILSTNIAETSITVEDVVFVVDVGKAKEKVYDSYNKLSALQTQWISRACAKQREGRAGRVRPGFCFRLYSNQRFSHMAEERVPEILRVSLEELCLNAKIIAPRSMNIYNFLSLAPDPPTANSVAVAIENLQSLGALDKEEDLTRLGEYLAQLTLEPRLGKMLIYGCIFKCLEPILTLAAAMAHKDPFQLPPQANLKTVAAAKRRELIEEVPSDHVIYIKVFQRWQEESSRGRSKQFCHDYFISESTMNQVLETRRQLLGQLRAVGFVNNTHCIDEFNVNSNSWGLVKAIMSCAFFPNVAYPVNKGSSLATRNEKKLSIHNMSVCHSKMYNNWCFFDEMVKNRLGFMIRGVTFVTPLAVAIMCGIDTIFPSTHSISIDNWLEFYFGNPVIIKFRKAIESLVEKSMMNPWHSFDQSNQIVSETLRKVIDLEEEQADLVQPKTIGARPKFLYKIVHDKNSSRNNSSSITRNGMRQPPNYTDSNTGNNSTDYIENHKKGRTPKRYVPPHKQQYTPNSAVARSLKFDNGGPSNSMARDATHGFENMALSSDSNVSSPAAALLKGLGVTPGVGAISSPNQRINSHNSNSYYETTNASATDALLKDLGIKPGVAPTYSNHRKNTGHDHYNYGNGSRNGYYNNYDTSSYNGYGNYGNYGHYGNDRHYGQHNNLNPYLSYNSGYGNPQGPSNNDVTMGFTHNITNYNTRRIVKQLDLTDYQYNDAYSMPPFPNLNNFDVEPLSFIDIPTPQPYLPDQIQNSTVPNVQQYQASWNAVVPNVGNSVLSATSEKDIKYVDNPVFVVIRASEKRNIDIAQSCNKWVFSPQTEKKVVTLYDNEKKVFLVFYVKELQMFMGIAEYKGIHIGKYFTKPTASITWKYTTPLHKNKTKHLLNPYNCGKPIYDSQDGVIIRQDVGEELMRIYSESEGNPN